MVVLKKVPSATLMETLVATVLIICVFTVSSLLLNGLFVQSVAQNTGAVEHELLLLEYEVQQGTVSLPYYEEIGPWLLSAELGKNGVLWLGAKHQQGGKQIKKQSVWFGN